MKKIIMLLTVIFLSVNLSFAKMMSEEEIKSSIVKIFTVANQPDFDAPWSSHVSEFTGSGCIIGGNRILTNAHVVADGTYVEVLKNGETKRYEAEVLSISHESDLALITVKDKSFFNETKSLPLGKLPKLQKEVTVYGYPAGGETLSITKGVVSRIEHQGYVHSGEYLLAIQIDAAINPGNSGGPAISNGEIMGIVMQGASYAENVGYIIPTTVIEHYLKDMLDQKHHGYPFFGIEYQDLESPVLQKMYKLADKNQGILINKTVPNSPASRVLKSGDILTSIDGYSVFNNGKVEFRKKEFTDFTYALDNHQIGDEVNLTIVRDGKEINLTIVLDKTYNDLMLVKERDYDKRPSYYIYGGLVFVPVNQVYMQYGLPAEYHDVYPSKELEELVMLYRVLSSELTRGFNQTASWIIDKVNGQTFKDFKTFVALLEKIDEEYVVFEDRDNYKLVVDRKEVLAKQEEILKRYNIKERCSDDLKSLKAKPYSPKVASK